MMTTDARALVEELRRLHEQATPAPWQFGHRRPHTATQPARVTLQTCGLPNKSYPAEPKPIVELRWFGTWPEADQALIQAMRNALPDLLALAEQGAAAEERIAELEAERDRLRDTLSRYADPSMGNRARGRTGTN